MALGMGNPVRYAALKPGEAVLDLGSGGGIDTLLAASQVGPGGRAIGLDMTEAMLERARHHATLMGLRNVEFRQADIFALPFEAESFDHVFVCLVLEHVAQPDEALAEIPLPDGSMDVIISNGVINLSTKKGRVFAECLRVLRPGGRLVFADSVVNGCLPKEVLENEAAYAG